MSQASAVIWRPIAQTSHQVVLYHPTSHALVVRPRAPTQPAEDRTPAEQGPLGQVVLALPPPENHTPLEIARIDPQTIARMQTTELCPYCYQTLPPSLHQRTTSSGDFSSQNETMEHAGVVRARSRSGGVGPYPRRGRRRASLGEGTATPAIARFSDLMNIVDVEPSPRFSPPARFFPSRENHSSEFFSSDSEPDVINAAEETIVNPATSSLQPAPPLTLHTDNPTNVKPYFRILERAHQEQGLRVSVDEAIPMSGRPTVRLLESPPAGDVGGEDVLIGSESNVEFPDMKGFSGGPREAVIPQDIGEERVAPGGAAGTTRTTTKKGHRSVEGYYNRFFVEEKRLGMGAEGSVYLCQHVLDSIPLGHYAVKKIAIGDSHSYLDKILKEVRLLETLRHENVVGYHHVWIEKARFGSIGEPVATLHMLMMYANAGNLDTYISHRRSSAQVHIHGRRQTLATSDLEPPTPASPADDVSAGEGGSPPTADQLKRAFKQRRASMRSGADGGVERVIPRRESEQRAVLLLSRMELGSLIEDVAAGLAFLHANSILHLDLKCSNVLLHRRDGMSIPTAMIADFGTSQEMIMSRRERTGNTGTMEYMAPESILPDHLGRFREMDSKVDMWAMGLIIHKLLFFRLPYERSDSFEDLEKKISTYRGYKIATADQDQCRARDIPQELLFLLEDLVNVRPARRPTSAAVKEKLRVLQLSTTTAVTPSRHVDGGDLRLLPLEKRSPESGDARINTTLALAQDVSRSLPPAVVAFQPRRSLSPLPSPAFRGLAAMLNIVCIFPPIQRRDPTPAVLTATICLAVTGLFAAQDGWRWWAALQVGHLWIHLAWQAAGRLTL